MIAITVSAKIERYRAIADRMMLSQKDKAWDFNPEWIRSHQWVVVPVESMGNLPIPDIPRVVSVLNQSGYTQCIVIATEDLGDLPSCYLLSINQADFMEYRRELGLFCSLITTEERTWCISCTESFNLFAGEERLVEALLGKPISEARRAFSEFAAILGKGDPRYPLLKMAEHWASL